MEKIQENNYFSCKIEFSSATKTSFFIKNTKNDHSSAVTGGEPPNAILKRTLELFLKVPPFKKILE